MPFRHENEVRLIYNSNVKLGSEIYRFNIDPFDLFDDIVFDPRMEYDDFKKFKLFLTRLNYKRRIVKSNLYKVTKLKFKFNSK